MKNFFYLHIWTEGETDSQTNVLDNKVHPIKLGNIGLEINDWYKDDLFRTFPLFICTERLKNLLTYEEFKSVDLTLIHRVNPGLDFSDNYPNAELGRFWLMEFTGECGKDDFALWKGLYLVVSEKALHFLRDNGVTHAESDEIVEDFESYFSSEKKNFWM